MHPEQRREVFAAMVPAPFRFLEVSVKLFEAKATLAGQTHFGAAPERPDAVDPLAAPGKVVVGVMYPVVAEAVAPVLQGGEEVSEEWRGR